MELKSKVATHTKEEEEGEERVEETERDRKREKNVTRFSFHSISYFIILNKLILHSMRIERERTRHGLIHLYIFSFLFGLPNFRSNANSVSRMNQFSIFENFTRNMLLVALEPMLVRLAYAHTHTHSRPNGTRAKFTMPPLLCFTDTRYGRSHRIDLI